MRVKRFLFSQEAFFERLGIDRNTTLSRIEIRRQDGCVDILATNSSWNDLPQGYEIEWERIFSDD